MWYKVPKIIKKTVTFLLVPGAILVLLPVFLFLILRIPFVQTYVIKGLTKYISSEIRSTVSVGKVEFAYFNKLILDDIIIKDRNNDTLLFAKKVTAGIRQLDLKKGIIRFGRVSIKEPVIGLITDSTGSSNLAWYLDKISSKSADTTKNPNSLFHISHVTIENGRFAHIDRRSKPSSAPIDFGKLRIDSIQGVVENFAVRSDSTMLDINELSFRESNGFRVKRLSSHLLLNNSNIIFTGINLICDSSIINARRVALMADSAGSFNRFLQEVRLDVNLNKSLVYLSDINYFAPLVKDLNESVWLSGHVSGTVSELKGRNIRMSYKNETNLDCSFDLSGLPDIKNTFIFFQINDFRSVSKDIEQINIPGKGKILVPDPLKKLGVVSFSGTFTGFTTDFVAYGKINTTKGLISIDISLRPEEKNKFRIKGLMKGIDIDLGSLTGNSDLLGKLTVETNVDGSTESFKKFAVNLTGMIDSVDINNYRYRDVELKGSFTDKAWDGDIKIHDRNIDMELLGMFDFNNKLPEFDFTLNLRKARFYNLNIDKKDTTSAASLLLTANFRGNSIDNLDGEIRLLNSSFRKYGKNLEVFDFSLKTFSENSRPAISLRTDFVDVDLKGRYNYTGLGNVARNALSVLIPSGYGRQKLPVTRGENDFSFNIRLKKTDELNNFLKTGMLIAENSTITGRILPDSIIFINGESKSFSVNRNVFADLKFDAKFADTTASAEISSSNFNMSGVSDLKDLYLGLEAVPDAYKVLLSWDNKDKQVNKGRFEARGSFSAIQGAKGKYRMTLALLPGEVDVRDKVWKISPSELIVDSSSVKISRFSINNNENYFLIDGSVSENPLDTLSLKFNGISLSPLNSLYEKNNQGPDMIHLDIGGTLNGRITLTNLYKSFMFESDIRVRDFSLLDSKYGDILIESVWNNAKKVAEINASNNLDGTKMFDIAGYYDPDAKNMDLTFTADKLPLDALNPLLKFFASGIGGKASGKLRLSGDPGKPFLTGSVWAEDATLKIDYTQAKYKFSDSIRFDSKGINFNNITLKDEKGNRASLNGTIYHNHFLDFAVDLTLKTKDCMVLNTKPKDNDVFYGTAYATGVTTIRTDGPLLKFNISAKTGKNTKFYIPLNSSMSVAENNFVSFVQPAGTAKENKSSTAQPSTPNSSGIEIAFDLEITPDAEVQLIMDPKTGDIMKGTGRGNLNINLDSKGVFKMFGDYTIENGDYLFTLGNIINKSFGVESGGKISFNGDVEDADIDMKAIYKTKASLYDIMPGILPESKQNDRIPVECQLLLSGKLFNPTVGFDIYLPTADEETRAYLRSMIKSEEEMSRQFLFLLVMNSFYSDQGSATQPLPAGMGSATVGVTTMEMLSNQLSNWLSQISNDFDIGVVYRPGTTLLPNSQELQVALSTQVLNDKVAINGNFDVAGAQATGTTGTMSGTNSFTGMFNVEYKINEKIRFKFFNRSNDNFYIDNGILYTQGVGLFFRQDFNKFKDLLKKSDKSDMKKAKRTKPVKTK
jgi:TamB, inner membrane protein subunit of TAM complex